MLPQTDRKPPERRNLALREKPLRELLYLETFADEFEIDADLATTSNRIKGDTLGMGEIETDRIPARVSGQGGLPMRAVAKRHGFRRFFEVAAEDLPERPARDDKALAIGLKVKPLGSRPFIFCKSV